MLTSEVAMKIGERTQAPPPPPQPERKATPPPPKTESVEKAPPAPKGSGKVGGAVDIDA